MRAALLGLALAPALFAAGCGKKDSDSSSPAGDGTVTWTVNGTTYTSTLYSGAVVDPGDRIVVLGSTNDQNSAVSLKLQGINAKGVGTYDLRTSTSISDTPSVGIVTFNGAGGQGTIYTTDGGSAGSHGTITVTQYDKAAQKLSGTFSFTATPWFGGGTGTQTVTNGSFNIKKFN